jgi:hypothetical protein
MLFADTYFCHKPGLANLAHGIYEALLDEDLSALLAQHPELRSVFAKIDPEEEPARYAAFLARAIEKALFLENVPSPACAFAMRSWIALPALQAQSF